MSCSPECLEFMEECYEEQKLEKEMDDYIDQNPYASIVLSLHAMRLRSKDATTVVEIKNVYQDVEAIYLKLKQDDRFMKILKNVISGATKAPITEMIDYIFTDDDCRKVSLMLSKPFPIKNSNDILEKWCSMGNDISDFFMATRRPECCNLIQKLVGMIAMFEDCKKNGTEPDDVILKKYKLSFIGEILPMLIVFNFVQIFDQTEQSKEEVKEIYESIEVSLEAYHELLSRFEDFDLTDESYLNVCDAIKDKYNEFKNFMSCFDLEKNNWQCGNIIYDFNDGSTYHRTYS